MNMKKIVIGLLAATALSWAQTVYADNATEFGIEDDLTILSTAGTAPDPDVEIRGFTLFGSTQAAYTGAVVGAGNVVVNGYLAVSSGMYVNGNSTFTARVDLPAVDKYTSPPEPDQVLTQSAVGGPKWSFSLLPGDNSQPLATCWI